MRSCRARAPGGLVRRALAFVLLASALKLFDVPNAATGLVLLLVLLVGAGDLDAGPPAAWLPGHRVGRVAAQAGLGPPAPEAPPMVEGRKPESSASPAPS